MIKKYIAKSDISLSVGKKHVSFRALTGGGSVYYTENEALQKALEAHHKYGKLFKVAPVEAVHVSKPKKEEPAKPAGPKQVVVTCLEDAKEYLVDTYELSRTKLRSKQSIVEAAAAKGIEFVGI